MEICYIVTIATTTTSTSTVLLVTTATSGSTTVRIYLVVPGWFALFWPKVNDPANEIYTIFLSQILIPPLFVEKCLFRKYEADNGDDA